MIYLVRDPRPVMFSRQNYDWCQANPNCIEADLHCRRDEKDLELFKRLKAGRPDRYYFLQYENLFSDLEEETQKLFEFIGLPFTTWTRLFLETHTRVFDPMGYSTYRYSSFVVSRWRSKMSVTDVESISKICSPLLTALQISH